MCYKKEGQPNMARPEQKTDQQVHCQSLDYEHVMSSKIIGERRLLSISSVPCSKCRHVALPVQHPSGSCLCSVFHALPHIPKRRFSWHPKQVALHSLSRKRVVKELTSPLARIAFRPGLFPISSLSSLAWVFSSPSTISSTSTSRSSRPVRRLSQAAHQSMRRAILAYLFS